MIKIIKMKPAMFLIAGLIITMSACQKKFDPSSYAPAETFGGYAASSEIAPSDLVAYWAFDGSLIDSISGTAATNSGTTFTNGIKGNSLQIGLNNYATFTPTAAIQNLQSMTLSYWVNTPINSAGIQEPICFANSQQFWGNLDMFFDAQTDASSVFKIHCFGNNGSTEAWLTNWSLTSPWGQWLHLVLTYDAPSTTFSFYVNGALVGSVVQADFGPLSFTNFPAIVFGTIQFQTTPSLTTATDAQSWASNILGSIDQVRIYDKALAATDVKALYQLENLSK